MHKASIKLLLEHRHSPEKHVLTVTNKTLAEILCEILAIQSANVALAPHYEISLDNLCAILTHLHKNGVAEHRPLIAQDLGNDYQTLTTSILGNAEKIKNGVWCVDTFWLWDWRDRIGAFDCEITQKTKYGVWATLINDPNAKLWF